MKLSLILLIAWNASAVELSPRYLKAIHQVETSGRYGPIKGDKGAALGPFQIHTNYFQDSGVGGVYSNCADYAFSVKVVTAYANRYEPKAVKSNNFEVLARLHKGGPNWRKNKKATDTYWQKKVKKELDKVSKKE